MIITEGNGTRGLGCSVIMRAFRDARKSHDTFNRRRARSFLKGSSKEWFDSLKDWCSVAEIDYKKIIDYAKKEGW